MSLRGRLKVLVGYFVLGTITVYVCWPAWWRRLNWQVAAVPVKRRTAVLLVGACGQTVFLGASVAAWDWLMIGTNAMALAGWIYLAELLVRIRNQRAANVELCLLLSRELGADVRVIYPEAAADGPAAAGDSQPPGEDRS